MAWACLFVAGYPKTSEASIVKSTLFCCTEIDVLPMKNIHIGKAIKQKVKERGLRVTDFANAIHCNRTNVYDIFNRKSIDIEQLILISKVLEYDFISGIYFNRISSKKYLVLLEVDEQQLQNFSANPSLKVITQLSE
jgi:transcriptional regulator with XRE-family HTH domain